MVTAAAAVVVGGLLSPAALATTAIQRENALPGTSAWNGPGSSQIELYTSQIGVAASPAGESRPHTTTAAAAVTIPLATRGRCMRYVGRLQG